MSTWGPAVDSKDYQLLIEGDTEVSRPVSIVGHALTSPAQETSDALTYNTVKLRRGKIVTISKTKRAAEETGRTYQIAYPSALMTALQIRAERQVDTTFYMKYLCAEDDQFSHAYVFNNSTLTKPVEAADPVTVDDVTILTHTSDVQVSERVTIWNAEFNKVATLEGAAATSLLDVVFSEEACNAGDEVENIARAFRTVGGNTGDDVYYATTSDRFATVTEVLDMGAAAGDYGHAVLDNGSIVAVAYNSESDLTATTGAVKISSGGGAFVAATGVSKPIYAFAELGNAIIGVGKGGTVLAAGPSGAFVSNDNGGTFTELTSNALGQANEILVDITVDEENDVAYAVGTDSDANEPVLLRMTESGGAIAVTDISAPILALSSTGLTAVAVLGPDHIMVGGLGGFVAETLDGGSNWSTVAVGTTDAITSIDGTANRTVVCAAGSFFYRDILNNMAFREGSLGAGSTITGNITRVRVELEGDANYFIIVTDDGEVILATPPHPWA